VVLREQEEGLRCYGNHNNHIVFFLRLQRRDIGLGVWLDADEAGVVLRPRQELIFLPAFGHFGAV
jgi:hypothetical protein